VLAIVLCVTSLEDTHAPVHSRIDLAGMATFTAAAGTLTFGLIKANEDGWATPASWVCIVASAVLFATFVLIERATAAPMLDLALMRNRRFVGVLVAGLVLTLTAFSAFTYTSIWLQSVLGLSPIEAGLTGLPLSASAFLVSAMIGRFLHGSRSGPIIGGGMLLIGAGDVLGAVFVHGSASWPALVPGFLIMGIGVGLATPTLGSSAMAAVPMQRGGMAAGAVNTARQLGFALGIAALGSVFATRAASVLREHQVPESGRIAKALAGGQAKFVLQEAPQRFHDALDTALHASAVSGLQWAFGISGVAGLVFGTLCWWLIRDPRSEPDHDGPAEREPALAD
jgi:MFS family permease